MACQLTQEVADHCKKTLYSKYYMEVKFTSALNKRGEVVDELHLMIRERTTTTTGNIGGDRDSLTHSH